MKTFTLKEVRELLNIHGSGIDPFEDEDLNPHYTVIDCETALIIDETAGLTVYNWIESRSSILINGEPWIDTEGLQVVRDLMHRYEQGLEVYPILVDKDFNVIDGTHRLAALNSLGIKTTKIFYPIGGIK